MSRYDKASLNTFVRSKENRMLIPKGSPRDKNAALFAKTLGGGTHTQVTQSIWNQ